MQHHLAGEQSPDSLLIQLGVAKQLQMGLLQQLLVKERLLRERQLQVGANILFLEKQFMKEKKFLFINQGTDMEHLRMIVKLE